MKVLPLHLNRMRRTSRVPALFVGLLAVAVISRSSGALQDNWVADFSFNAPPPGIGSCSGIGVDGSDRIYVADVTHHVVHVFNPSGEFQRSLAIQADDWMDEVCFVGGDDRLYLSGRPPFETRNHTIYTTDGTRIGRREFGERPLDAAVAANGEVYVIVPEEPFGTNARIRVFSAGGIEVRTLGGPELMGFGGAASVGLSPQGTVIVSTTNPIGNLGDYKYAVLSYAPDGTFEQRLPDTAWGGTRDIGIDGTLYLGGIIGTVEGELLAGFNNSGTYSAIGVNPRTGALYALELSTSRITAFRRTFRTPGASPARAVPMPGIQSVSQRSNGLVDLDCLILDTDSPTVTTALCAYRDGSQLLKDLVPVPVSALVEGTAGKLGTNTTTGSMFRLTVNPSSTTLPSGNLVFELFARDDRPSLLDLDYLTLPGAPALTISRSPVTHEDLRHVWAWLLASGNPELTRSAEGEIVGPGGSFTETVMLSYGAEVIRSRTTPEGRAWIFAKLGAREATAAEVTRARQASTSGTPNRFTPPPTGRVIGNPAHTPGYLPQPDGRPMAANEWTFDTWDQWHSEFQPGLNNPHLEAWWLVRLP